MRDGFPTLTLKAKPAKRLARAVLLSLAGSFLSLGAQGAPVIGSISPESGSVLNSMTITGTGFGARKGNSTVTFAGTEAARYSSWSDTRIEVMPPTRLGLQPSAVVVTVAGMASNALPSSNLPPLWVDCGEGTLAEPAEVMDVTISRQLPQSGPVLVYVSYTGTALADVDFSGAPFVRMNTGQAEKQFELGVIDDRGREEDETIIITVSAEGYSPHSCQITLKDNDRFGLPAPVISELDRNEGRVGDEVWIIGSNFGATKGTSRVDFDKRQAATVGWNPTLIRATVPEGATTGNVVVEVEGQSSNGIVFTVIPRPVISSLNPTSGPVGTSVEITGSHFGATKEYSSVTFNGRQAATTRWSATSITATVPEGAATGDVVVTVLAQQSDGVAFTVIPKPVISGLNPTSGPVGTSVAITGSHFGATKGTSSVTFNGKRAATTRWSATSITATVPEGAATGDVVVEVSGQQSDGVAFTVTGVTVVPTELTIEEGKSATYSVVLDSKPASAVTVAMFTPSGTDLSVDILPVFTASNWNRPQTVTVTAGQDEDTENDTVTITHRTTSADSTYHDLAVDPLVVTITDDDAGAGVTVNPTGLTIEEGEEGTYTVVLNTEPAAAVTVTVTAGAGLTVSPQSLGFTPSNWETPQTVTVTAPEDNDAEDETETIIHGVATTDPDYSRVVVPGVRVVVADDEGTGGPGGTEELTVSTTRLRITEGNMGLYTVVLNRAPVGAVTVAVAGAAGSDLTVSPASLDFTTTNWDRPQEVTVSVGQDDDLVDELASITHTITRSVASSSSSVRGGVGRHAAFATAMSSPAPTREYVYLGDRLVAITAGGSIAEVSVVVTIDDDDDPETPGVPALTNSLTLTEGHTGAYTLELGAEPTADVTITLSVSPGSDGVADVTVNPTSLTFTAADWDIPQWVTVSVGGDADTVGETETVSHTATSTDSRYQGIEITRVQVVIQDRNQTRIPTGTLTANPKLCRIEEGQTTCSTTLTWTSENTTAVHLRRIAPTINKVVVQSGKPNGNTSSKIELGAHTFILYDYTTGSRGNQLASVTVRGFTGATPGITVTPTSLTVTEGQSGSYTVVLDSQPTSTVTITIWAEAGLNLNSPSNSTLSFSGSNWSTAQTVTFTAAEDANKSNETASVTHTLSSSDVNYKSLTVPAVEVTIDDNDDTPGITVTPTSLTVTEGQSGSYTVVLDSEPISTVTITIWAEAGLNLTSPSDSTLRFSGSNWSTAQTVTFTAAEDANKSNETANFTHDLSSSDKNYKDLTVPSVTVTIDDNDDTPGITVTPTSLTVTEGQSGSYTVVLDSQPTSAVTITIWAEAGLNLTSPSNSTLSFSGSNWSTAQTVTFTAVEDANKSNETAYFTHDLSSSDTNYKSLTVPAVEVTIDDNDDSAGVTVTPTSLTVTEGQSGSYTVVLDSQPTSAVTITIWAEAGLNLTSPSNSTLSFSGSNWSTAQTVSFTAEEDANTSNETAYFTHDLSSSDTNYKSLTVPAVEVTIRDNDTSSGAVIGHPQSHGNSVIALVHDRSSAEQPVVHARLVATPRLANPSAEGGWDGSARSYGTVSHQQLRTLGTRQRQVRLPIAYSHNPKQGTVRPRRSLGELEHSGYRGDGLRLLLQQDGGLGQLAGGADGFNGRSDTEIEVLLRRYPNLNTVPVTANSMRRKNAAFIAIRNQVGPNKANDEGKEEDSPPNP